MNENLLEMHEVTSVYGSMVVIENVSIEVEKGKTVCILGSNGAGKTTLINTILGLVRVINGRIIFKGEDITGQPTYQIVRRGMSVVPQGKRIFPKMTTLENLRMGAYTETSQELIEARMEEVFEIFPVLKERSSQIAGTLSGGEQSMLSIGRGLMSKPELLLFDEPSLGLAPILVERNFEIIQQINDAGVTVLLVEQNANLTLEISDYGYVIQKGRVAFKGTADDLRESELIKAAYLHG